MDIDVYSTDSTGRLMMPEALKFGDYELIEVQTAYGYVLDSNPVKFKVDGTNAVVTVEKHNFAQKGVITVSKTGEVFSTVREAEKTYQPVYEMKGLAGATYEVTAEEDIVEPSAPSRAKWLPPSPPMKTVSPKPESCISADIPSRKSPRLWAWFSATRFTKSSLFTPVRKSKSPKHPLPWSISVRKRNLI